MRALVSGQAGLAMLFDGDTAWSTNVESPECVVPRAPADALYLFAYADDVMELVDVTSEQVTTRLEENWRCDRALQLTLILLDHEDDEETRVMAAECVEEHFSYDGVEEFVANRLYSAPLPTAADMLGAKLYAEKAGANRVAAFLQSLDAAQMRIAQLRDSWDELSGELLHESDKRRQAENTVIATGWFRRFAQAALAGNLEAELMHSLQDESLRSVPNCRRVLTQWIGPLKAKHAHNEDDERDDGLDDDDAANRVDKSIRKGPRRRRPRSVRNEPSIHESWTRVQTELDAIVALVDRNQIDQAIQYTSELVARQLREKRPDFAAKSLCNLSKQMKSRRLFDLQLRWAQKAVEVMSTDPQAHTQLADAHLCFGRLDEALRLYDYTMQNFPHDEVAPCGRAEVLRELGRLDDALRLYEETMQRFPQNEVAHCGRAEVLRELGRLDEALRLYEETMQRFPQDEVARCGRAEVLRELGRLDEALRLYEETMQRFPQSEVARCGRAIVLMELHKFDEALDLLPQSVPRIRQDWIAFHIRGMVHLRRGDIDKAAEVFRRGVRECPIVSSMKYFRGALAVAQLIRGQYGDVESTLRGVEGETADVLRLHAYGEQGQDEQARTAYERLQESQRKRVQELRDELAPVYIFAEQVALRSSQAWRDKIHRQECQLVWLTAA